MLRGAARRGGRASAASVTCDRQKGFRGGCVESTPPQRRLTDVHPGVCGRRAADGEAPPEAVQPSGDPHPVPLPVHMQLFDRPGRTQGMSDNEGESGRWQY